MGWAKGGDDDYGDGHLSLSSHRSFHDRCRHHRRHPLTLTATVTKCRSQILAWVRASAERLPPVEAEDRGPLRLQTGRP